MMRTHILDISNFYLKQFQSNPCQKTLPLKKGYGCLEKKRLLCVDRSSFELGNWWLSKILAYVLINNGKCFNTNMHTLYLHVLSARQL